MPSDGFFTNGRQIQFMSDEGLVRIEETAFRLLDEVGIELTHAPAVEMLHGAGCRVEGNRVHFPRQAVEWGLKNVTPHTEFYNRDGSPAFRSGGGKFRFHNAGGLPFVYDLDTGERRRPMVEDVAQASRLLDALPNVDIVIPLFGPMDVAPEMLAIASTNISLRNTCKPFSSAAIEEPRDVPFVVEMAAACCGGMEAYRQRPNMYISISPVSPLRCPDHVAATIIAVAQIGAPFNSLPAPVLGATGPITLAGALAQQHAEVLASFVLAAAARPGASVCYCSRISPIDLRTATSSWGGPEIGMSGATAAQLAHRIGLPCDTFGLCTSATRLDPQFAYERLANALTPALGGADVLSGVGSAESVLAGGLQIAVIDDEIISMMRYIAGGIQVDDTTLAYDVIQEVAPRDGVFLGELHTARQVRKGAAWMPTVGDRTGNASGVDRATARARELLRKHPAPELAPSVVAELDDIMARAERELVER